VAAEPGFIIDGRRYDIPSIDTFTIDEAQILYDYSGLTLEDFAAADDGDADELEPKFRNPGFLRTLLHVAYQRGNPKANPQRVRTLIGTANLIETLQQLAETVEEDAGPPVSTTEPDGSSPTSSAGSSESSGTASDDDSVAQVAQLARTTDGNSPPSAFTPKISAL
jgi:hypothetical protein